MQMNFVPLFSPLPTLWLAHLNTLSCGCFPAVRMSFCLFNRKKTICLRGFFFQRQGPWLRQCHVPTCQVASLAMVMWSLSGILKSLNLVGMSVILWLYDVSVAFWRFRISWEIQIQIAIRIPPYQDGHYWLKPLDMYYSKALLPVNLLSKELVPKCPKVSEAFGLGTSKIHINAPALVPLIWNRLVGGGGLRSKSPFVTGALQREYCLLIFK